MSDRLIRDGSVLQAASEDQLAPGPLLLDLRGIKCPLNWAHAKVRLETMRRGELIELLIDDPRGVRDIPQAAEAEGYSMVEVRACASAWRLRIEK